MGHFFLKNWYLYSWRHVPTKTKLEYYSSPLRVGRSVQNLGVLGLPLVIYKQKPTTTGGKLRQIPSSLPSKFDVGPQCIVMSGCPNAISINRLTTQGFGLSTRCYKGRQGKTELFQINIGKRWKINAKLEP